MHDLVAEERVDAPPRAVFQPRVATARQGQPAAPRESIGHRCPGGGLRGGRFGGALRRRGPHRAGGRSAHGRRAGAGVGRRWIERRVSATGRGRWHLFVSADRPIQAHESAEKPRRGICRTCPHRPARIAWQSGMHLGPALSAGSAPHLRNPRARAPWPAGVGMSGTEYDQGLSTGQSTPPPGARSSRSVPGGTSSCGVRATGAVDCWGEDFRLGGTSPRRWAPSSRSASGRAGAPGSTPAASATPAPWTAGVRIGPVGPHRPRGARSSRSVPGSEHTCGVRDTGAVACWGNDYFAFNHAARGHVRLRQCRVDTTPAASARPAPLPAGVQIGPVSPRRPRARSSRSVPGGSTPAAFATRAPWPAGVRERAWPVHAASGRLRLGQRRGIPHLRHPRHRRRGSAGVRNEYGQSTPPMGDAPDLVVRLEQYRPLPLVAGVDFDVNIRNQGTARAAATTLRYYRSSDPTISSSDTELAMDPVSALDAFGRIRESLRHGRAVSAGQVLLRRVRRCRARRVEYGQQLRGGVSRAGDRPWCRTVCH